MTSESDDFAELFARAKAGCPAATGELFARYGEHVRIAASRRLAGRLRTQVDSVDCAQDVWVSLLKASVARLEFPTEKAFLAYLTRMAANKVGEEYRRRASLKHDLTRERSIGTEPVARQSTPSQCAAAGERWDELVRDLSAPQREILELLRDGCTHEDIGQRLGVHAKTVQRLVQRLKERSDR